MRISYSRASSPDILERRRLLAQLLEAGLASVEPSRCVRSALDDLLSSGFRPPRATVFAIGKAAVGMAQATTSWLRERNIALHGGVVVGPDLVEIDGLATRQGGHPLPSSDAVDTGRLVESMADHLGPEDTAICLISGGGSAMLELPQPGIELSELTHVGRVLMERGANIAELNAVRARLSILKGGGLARALAPARIVNIILSDVPGDGPEVVASGPTLPHTANLDASAILARYELLGELSAAARRTIALPSEDRDLPESTTIVAADNRTARAAIVREATLRGLTVIDREGFFKGDARSLGAELERELSAGDADRRAFVWGGETTVVVRGEGRGGRNHEVVLGAVASGWRSGLLAAFGTDGVDGSSNAAGAFVDEEVLLRVEQAGLDANDSLTRNDSGAFFADADAQLVTGPTGTNVADVLIYLPVKTTNVETR